VNQDESIFAQFLLGSKVRVGPKVGQHPLLPKTDGDCYVLSASVLRVFGFGKDVTDTESEMVDDG
jgi:hypothetical protein